MKRAALWAAVIGFSVFAGASQAGAQRGQRFFELLDRNRDGVVTLGEMRAMRTRRMAAIDINRDGRISRREFMSARPPWAKGRKQPGMERRRARIFARIDTDRDGVISPTEREASLMRWFARMDADRDGRLTRREFATARQWLRGGPDRRFERLDANRDGAISFQELLDRRADQMQAADRDKDGKVSRREFLARGAGNGVLFARRQKLFERLDADRDGYITPLENGMALKGWFARLDANRDGQLTQQEIEVERSRQALPVR
jgi:Ca2+-binding EF-hand superfamily protein